MPVINGDCLRHRDEEGMTNFKTAQCLQNITPKNMCNPTFFRALFEMQIFPLDLSYKGDEPHFIYDSIIPILKGEEVTPPPWAKEFHQDQRSGTCAWKCLMAHLKDMLPDGYYRLLSVLIKFNTLKKFMAANPVEKSKKLRAGFSC